MCGHSTMPWRLPQQHWLRHAGALRSLRASLRWTDLKASTMRHSAFLSLQRHNPGKNHLPGIRRLHCLPSAAVPIPLCLAPMAFHSTR